MDTVPISNPPTPSDAEVLRAMAQFGGDFFRRLATALLYADRENMAKAKATWPDQWAHYTYLAAMTAAAEVKP